MSEREFQGYVTVRQKCDHSMFTLRANLGSTKVKSAVKTGLKLTVPKRGTYAQDNEVILAWMSPDELLIIVPEAERSAAFAALELALEGLHYLLADVSDARARFTIEGGSAREVVAKLAPMDLSAAQFPVGGFARTRFAQVAGAIFVEQEDRLSLICFRSVQDYVFALLCGAAKLGSEVRAQS
jgi:sarcosine oxidase subunit gamma